MRVDRTLYSSPSSVSFNFSIPGLRLDCVLSQHGNGTELTSKTVDNPRAFQQQVFNVSLTQGSLA